MFKDLKVLELASVLAGPSVGQFFAELGADVVKVENLKTGGDVTRTWKTRGEHSDDRSAYFCSVNWGKRSIALDLTTKEGRDIIHRLARQSSIVIASYKPGDAEKLEVDYKTLAAINPRIIYGQITGYGAGNHRVGYDAVIQAEGGFMYMNGERGGRSLKMPVALIDVLAAHQLKEGILLSMIKLQQSGVGSLVEVSLLQAAVSSLVNQATNWLMTHHLPEKEGSSHPNIAPYGDTFETSDGMEILLAVGNDKQFADLCRLLTLYELPNTSHFINNSARVQNRDRLNQLLQEKICEWDSTALMEKLHEKKIPAGLIQNLEQVFSMEEAKCLILNSEEVFGLKTYIGNIGERTNPSLLPPPHFGEHSLAIVSELK